MIYINDGTKKWIADDITGDGNLMICDISGKSIAEVYNSKDADLIKSAPDLLEAASELLQAYGTIIPTRIKKEVEALKQAIKRAKRQ